MDKKKIVVVSVWIVFIVCALVLLQWRVSNVVLNIEENNYKIGDNLTGKLTITIESGEIVPEFTPVLVSLTDENNKVLAVNSVSLKKFIESSDNVVESVQINGKKYYETPGTYSVSIDKIMTYTFNERGDYELFFNVLKLDIAVKKRIIVR